MSWIDWIKAKVTGRPVEQGKPHGGEHDARADQSAGRDPAIAKLDAAIYRARCAISRTRSATARARNTFRMRRSGSSGCGHAPPGSPSPRNRIPRACGRCSPGSRSTRPSPSSRPARTPRAGSSVSSNYSGAREPSFRSTVSTACGGI
jgi:hypothetical protein